MKILLAIEAGGHVFWQRNKYEFIMIDTSTASAKSVTASWTMTVGYAPEYLPGPYEVEYYFTQNGVEAQVFHCSSGCGKVPHGERFVAIPNGMYDLLVILENKQKRLDEKSYEGNWRDNSDFER